MKKLAFFSPDEIKVVNRSVAAAEEIVANHYKLSAGQLLRLNYDIKTLAGLSEEEIVDGHFAQIVRYAEKKKGAVLNVPAKDFYKICIQDHSILAALKKHPELKLFAFLLYIVSHEMIHLFRFRRFLQLFDAPFHEKMAEEMRVHQKTHEILGRVGVEGMKPVLSFYETWLRSSPEPAGK
jgi:hypothetical protein